MRFTYAEAMTRAEYYAPLAQAAEAAGYTSMTVADSLIYPRESDATYPYTDTGDREFLAKYTPAGKLAWATLTPTSSARINTLAIDRQSGDLLAGDPRDERLHRRARRVAGRAAR